MRALRMVALRLGIAGLALLCALLALEIVVRVAGEESADGQFSFAGRDLQPYALPLQRFAEQISEYEDHIDAVTLIYSEGLGWEFRPNSSRHDGAFSINAAGLRAQREYPLAPPADALRIALFGDSFTAGDDVADDLVWSHLLELTLNQAGLRAEALNFGVSAYGMDQAYLRWRRDGAAYAPDIVVFGLQAENLDRNVNVFRQLLHPLGPPFSKPRFVLNGATLELVNSPAIPPAGLLDIFESFESHPLAVHEAHYRSREYARQWWAGSRLAGFVHEALSKGSEDAQADYGLESERGRLSAAIVEAFATDARQRGSAFIVVFLPHQEHLSRWHYTGDVPYRSLLEYFSQRYHYLSFADQLNAQHLDESFWGPTLHYGAELNRALAEFVAGEVLSCVESGACPLPRLEDPSVIYAASSR